MFVCAFHFSIRVALSQVLRMSDGHLLTSLRLTLRTCCKILCICFLSWFSGFGGKSGMPVVVVENLWCFVSAEWVPRFSVSSKMIPLCLAVLTHFNNPVLRGHRPHLPKLIGVSACESLLLLALNLRAASAEAVLKSVLFVDFDLLAGWAFVIRRAVGIVAALLLVYALYAHLPECLPVEAPWISRNENRGEKFLGHNCMAMGLCASKEA